MSATVLAAHLARVIDDAAIFAGRDSTLPMLNGVQLESSPKHLIAVGTDRFAMGSAVADYQDGDGSTFTSFLTLQHAQMLSKIAKSAKSVMNSVTITDEPDSMKFEFTSGEVLVLPKTDAAGSFPDWRKIIEAVSAEDGSTQAFGVNPQYMSKFGRVTDSSRMIIRFRGPAKAACVSVGEQFFGVIMPIRLDDAEHAPSAPAWLVRPEPPKPKARRKTQKKAAA